MTTIRTLLLCAATLVSFTACGGSGNGDVTIATDDPPPGSKASPGQAGPVATDATTDRAAPLVSATGDRRAAGSPQR